MKQEGEGAGDGHTADASDLAIHVALVDGGALDVVGDVSGFGEGVQDAAQDGGLARAGGGNEGSAGALFQGAQDAVAGLVEEGQTELVADAHLAGKGGSVAAKGTL